MPELPEDCPDRELCSRMGGICQCAEDEESEPGGATSAWEHHYD
jgi:hypothetical protein